MGKEDDKKKKDKDKDKDKKDKDKDKDKKDKDKDKDKKDKDKDKDKKDKDKDKDKDKKDKDKKEKKDKGDEEWKLGASKNLDIQISTFEGIANRFKDIDNYILKDATSKEDFIAKVQKSISDLPEATQNVFAAFLNTL